MDKRFELKLTAMAHGGEAIGRHDGKVIFVPYAIPGEVVRVKLTEEHPRYARAQLLNVIVPSPARVPPACPHFGAGKCGGCQWQHIAYPVQARIKGLVVLDQFVRIGQFSSPPVLEPIPDESGWEYRNHALFHADSSGRLGFLQGASHTVYPVEECLILHPLVEELFSALEMTYPELEVLELRSGTATGDLMLVFQARGEEPPSLQVDLPASVVQVRHDGAIAPLVGLDYVTEIVRGREFRISATSFYQVNTHQATQLVELVLAALDLSEDEIVLDAYSGVGLFTAFLSEVAGRVIGIEAHPASVADARHNLAGAEHVKFLSGTVEEVLPSLDMSLDAAVLDPPRGGLAKESLDALVACAPLRVVYVSCDPATLARDARRMVRQGYTLQWIQPIDLFPQTYHIESVALLTKLP